MIQIEWTDPAVVDLQNIVNYIAGDSIVYADAMAEQIISSCELAASFPNRGRIVPEVGDSKIREIIISPYRIIYRIRRNLVQILSVIHGARDIGSIKPKHWM